MTIFLLLIFAHALCDYPLQGDFLAKAKNKFMPITGVPWWQAMIAHASIHAGAVGLITGNVYLGVAEFIAHFIIDYLKCANKLSFNQDQLLHVGCKIVWVLVVVA